MKIFVAAWESHACPAACKTLLSCSISKMFFFALSYLCTVGGQSLCWTAPSETWTRKHWWAFNMSELVIRWSSFWKMLVMTTSNYIHPLCAQWDRQRRGSLSGRQVILHLGGLLSCWTMDRTLSEILHTWNLLVTPCIGELCLKTAHWECLRGSSQFDSAAC